MYTNIINSRHIIPPVVNVMRGKERSHSAKLEKMRDESKDAKQKNINILLLVTFVR
jgi:hypothetical protein